MEEKETTPDTVDTKVKKKKVWLFPVLVAAAAGVMLISWFMPWWSIDVEGFACNVATIRPWGLDVCPQMGDFAILMKGTSMPSWFAPFMWTYLGLCLIALVIGAFVISKEIRLGKFKIMLSQFLVGGVGLSYIVAGIVAAVYAAIRMKNAFGVPLVGRTFLDLGDPLIAYVDTYLLPGYYLIYVAGLLLLVVAIFQDKITGAQKPGA